MIYSSLLSSFFFFNDTATTEIYTLSLHDALPIFCVNRPGGRCRECSGGKRAAPCACFPSGSARCGSPRKARSEEHTSELQSQSNLVCRLLLEKKKTSNNTPQTIYL